MQGNTDLHAVSQDMPFPFEAVGEAAAAELAGKSLLSTAWPRACTAGGCEDFWEKEVSRGRAGGWITVIRNPVNILKQYQSRLVHGKYLLLRSAAQLQLVFSVSTFCIGCDYCSLEHLIYYSDAS